MNPMTVISLVLAVVGILLIISGAWMTLKDWQKKREGIVGAKAESLDKTLSSLAKVLNALKDYPAGQRLIVLGIIVLIIALVFGGFSIL
jgi:uncharacterized membrane protein